MNPMAIMKIKGLITKFCDNHPKLFPFFKAAGKEIKVDTIIEVSITTAEGKNLCTNLKVRPEDVELVRELMEITKS